jgi:hypothetical protein
MPVLNGLPGFAANPPVEVLQLAAVDDPEIQKPIDLFGGINGFVPCAAGMPTIAVIQERRRINAEWSSRPDKMQVLDSEYLTQMLAQQFSMILGFPLDDATLEGLREWAVGAEPILLADARAASDQYIRRALQQKTNIIMRSLASLLIKMISATTLAYKQDGASHSVDNPWLPTAIRKFCVASWLTASTNILSEFQTFLEAFYKQAGGPPTDIYVGPAFAKNIATNTYLLDLITHNPGFLQAGPSFGQVLGLANIVNDSQRQELRGATVHVMGLLDESGTEQWDSDVMVLTRNPSGRACKIYGPRTIDAGGAVGLYTKQWRQENPICEMRAVGLTAIPAIVDWTQIMVCNINHTS